MSPPSRQTRGRSNRGLRSDELPLFRPKLGGIEHKLWLQLQPDACLELLFLRCASPRGRSARILRIQHEDMSCRKMASLQHPSWYCGKDTIGGIPPEEISPLRPQTVSRRKPGEDTPSFLESWGRGKQVPSNPSPLVRNTRTTDRLLWQVEMHGRSAGDPSLPARPRGQIG